MRHRSTATAKRDRQSRVMPGSVAAKGMRHEVHDSPTQSTLTGADGWHSSCDVARSRFTERPSGAPCRGPRRWWPPMASPTASRPEASASRRAKKNNPAVSLAALPETTAPLNGSTAAVVTNVDDRRALVHDCERRRRPSDGKSDERLGWCTLQIAACAPTSPRGLRSLNCTSCGGASRGPHAASAAHSRRLAFEECAQHMCSTMA